MLTQDIINVTARMERLEQERDHYARNADYYRSALDYVATTLVADCDKLRAEVARLTAVLEVEKDFWEGHASLYQIDRIKLIDGHSAAARLEALSKALEG